MDEIMTIDANILLAIKQGDHVAFHQFYHIYAADVFARIKRLVHDPAIAEELHQDVFMQIWERRASLPVDVPIRAIVMRSAKSIAIDFFRKAARDQQLREQLILSATELYDHLGELMDFKDTNQALQAAISKLPPQRLKVFTLCKLQGYSYEYAANEFGVSLSTIKDHMAKAISAIKQEMATNPAALYVLVAASILR